MAEMVSITEVAKVLSSLERIHARTVKELTQELAAAKRALASKPAAKGKPAKKAAVKRGQPVKKGTTQPIGMATPTGGYLKRIIR